jgi:hypothetical protein
VKYAILFAVLLARGAGEVFDRVVASVDGRAITRLELDRGVLTGGLPRENGESEEAYRGRVLTEVIDEYLRYRDAERFAPAPPAAREIDDAYRALRERLAREGKDPDVEFRAAGMSEPEIRGSVEKQLVVRRYIQDRIVSLVMISPEEIQAAYEGPFAEVYRRDGRAAPPLDGARETIGEDLRNRKINAELEKWTQDLRAKARIRILGEGPPLGPRKPVVVTKVPG